jgi:hypothetical protein
MMPLIITPLHDWSPLRLLTLSALLAFLLRPLVLFLLLTKGLLIHLGSTRAFLPLGLVSLDAHKRYIAPLSRGLGDLALGFLPAGRTVFDLVSVSWLALCTSTEVDGSLTDQEAKSR